MEREGEVVKVGMKGMILKASWMRLEEEKKEDEKGGIRGEEGRRGGKA